MLSGCTWNAAETLGKSTDAAARRIVRPMAVNIEKGWSVIQPFTVLAADGLTVLDASQYTVQSSDINSGNPAAIRATLQADNRSVQLDAIGNANDGSNVRVTTKVGGVTHNASELVTIDPVVDRSGPVFGTPGAPFRTP